jgi:23S rRNA pseudouridine1911/1915/1917 synthase
VDPALAAALSAFGRQALHAWRVAFTHPITRDRLRLEAPIAQDLQGLLTASGLSPLSLSALEREQS